MSGGTAYRAHRPGASCVHTRLPEMSAFASLFIITTAVLLVGGPPTAHAQADGGVVGEEVLVPDEAPAAASFGGFLFGSLESVTSSYDGVYDDDDAQREPQGAAETARGGGVGGAESSGSGGGGGGARPVLPQRSAGSMMTRSSIDSSGDAAGQAPSAKEEPAQQQRQSRRQQQEKQQQSQPFGDVTPDAFAFDGFEFGFGGIVATQFDQLVSLEEAAAAGSRAQVC